MSLDTLIRRALDSGVELALVDGQITMIGRSSAVQQWRAQLREHKAGIYQHLTAANDPTNRVFEKPWHHIEAPWRELAQAYHAHHFKCTPCKSAGQGRGQRCGAGAALWVNYQSAT